MTYGRWFVAHLGLCRNNFHFTTPCAKKIPDGTVFGEAVIGRASSRQLDASVPLSGGATGPSSSSGAGPAGGVGGPVVPIAASSSNQGPAGGAGGASVPTDSRRPLPKPVKPKPKMERPVQLADVEFYRSVSRMFSWWGSN